MKAEEWERIKALFDAALQHPPAERLRWLEKVCESQPDLFKTVRELIHSYEEASWPDPRKSEAASVFSAGDLVGGRFLILRLIAHGGMGEVYEATDNSLCGIKVALKTLRLGTASEQQAYERFKREVWVAREIVHPGICRVFDLIEHKHSPGDGTETTIPCLTMNLLEGENLATYLSRQGPLSVEVALPIIRQLTECIEVIHNNKIVHRDIKPSNVMLIPKTGDVPQIVLIDFGLAKPINNRIESWQTKTEHQQPGAPYFIPPEALRGEPVGPPADIYALGLVIDEMVSTRPAYRYESIEELFWRKLHDKPEPLRTRSVDLPQLWEKTILRCLDCNPAKRPLTAKDVLHSLECTEEGNLSETFNCVMQALAHARYAGSLLGTSSRRKWIAGFCTGGVAVAGVGAYKSQHADLSTSLLVLPFENLLQERYDALCVGTTEELTRRLSYVRGLTVLEAARSWKPNDSELKGIRFLLKGMIHDEQGVPQLAIQLVDNRTGHVVWAESFERELQQPLRLESILVTKTIDQLRTSLQRDEPSPVWLSSKLLTAFGVVRSELIPRQATTSQDAVLAYQRGRTLWQKRRLDSVLEAVKSYKIAIQIDPNYALAYAALADVQHTLLTYGYGSTRDLMFQAIEYAEKAVSIDNTLPECHVARAAAKQNVWNWTDSDISYRLAIESHPRFARAHHWYAGFLLQFGAIQAALEQAHLGLSLAPFDYPAQSNYGLYLWYSGKPVEAVRQLESVVEKVNLFFAHIILGDVCAYLAAKAAEPDATWYFNRSMEHAGLVRAQELNDAVGPEPHFLKWSDRMLVHAYAARRDFSSAYSYISRLEQGVSAGKIPATVLAWGYAALKQWKQTLDMLEYGADQQEREMLYTKVYPLFQPLSGNSRYTSILKRMYLV